MILINNFKKIIASLILGLLVGCGGGGSTSPENPIQPLGGPFGEKASVKTDGAGNYMIVWKDGASIFSKYYPMGVGQAPFRVEFGEGPEFDMDINGNAYLVYHRAESDNRNIQNSFYRTFDVASQSWQSERFLTFRPSNHNFAPQVATYDDLMLMTSRVSQNSPTQTGRIAYGHLPTDLSTPMNFDPFPLGNGRSPIYAPVIKMGRNNQAIMLWSQDQFPGVYAAHYFYFAPIPSRSGWSGSNPIFNNLGVRLSTGAVRQGNYRLAMTAGGDAVAAWVELHPSAVSVNASSLWTSVYSAQTEQWVTTRVTQNSLEDDLSFDLSVDGQGRAFLFWEDTNLGLQREILDPGTQTWSTAQTIHNVGNYQGITSYQSNTGNGGVVYSVDDEVYLSIYDLISDQWSPAELIGNGVSPDLAVDDKRECLAVWQDGGFIFEYQCSDVPLEVIIANDLGGKVVSDPVGIECGLLLGARTTNCKSRYEVDLAVTLIPTADSFFAFDSWGGDCSNGSPGVEPDSVIVNMDVGKSCTANFISTSTTTSVLAVNKLGTGDGIVTSDISGINCGATCLNNFNIGETIVLTAMEDSISTFASWSGTGDCLSPNQINGNSIEITLTQDSSCHVTFDAIQVTLDVAISGNGSGSLATQNFEILCGNNFNKCSRTFDAGTDIRLLANPDDTRSVFSNWLGFCASLDPLDQLALFTITQDVQCTAVFDTVPAVNISVTKSGQGDGTVVSNVPGINCGTDCTEPMGIGATIILTATPNSNSTFASWSGTGDCANPVQINANDLTISVSQDSECIAIFDPISTGNVTLTVIILGGPGAGNVRSTETPMPVMDCLNSNEVTTTCTASYPINSGVTLITSMFQPNNFFFTTGCTSFVGVNFDCFVNLNQDRTVTIDIGQYPTYDISASVTGNGSIRTFGIGEIIFGNITCPSINCTDTFIVVSPGVVSFEAHPDAGSTFVSWGLGQCDNEQIISGVGICNINLTPGSPTTRQVDAVFQ